MVHSLPANSVHTWEEMETPFHSRLRRVILDVTIAELALMKQYNNESVGQYIYDNIYPDLGKQEIDVSYPC